MMTVMLQLLRIGRWVNRVAVFALAAFLVLACGTYLWGYYHYSRSGHDMKLDRLDDARSSIEQCLTVWPRSAKANFRAAQIYRMSYSRVEAEKHLEIFKGLSGADDDFQMEWVLLRAQTGDFAKLEKGLLACLNNGKHEPAVLECLSHSYSHQLRFQQAHHYLDRWLEVDQGNVRALDLRGWVRERIAYFDGALDDYQQALKLSPRHWKVRVRLARMLLVNQKLAEAREHLSVLERSHPEQPEVLLYLAQCRVLEGKLDEARPLVDSSIAKDPTNPHALNERGKIDYQKGNFAAAELWFRKAIAVDGTFLHARFFLYNCLQQQGKKELAAEALRSYGEVKKETRTVQEILDKVERKSDPNLLVQAGEIISRQGNEDLGNQFLYRALHLDSSNQRAHELLAAYFSRKNNPQQAQKHLSFLKQTPDH